MARDLAEEYQLYVLGGTWNGQWEPGRDRLREAYFAQFPRNPRLLHRYWVADAKAAWDAGERTMTALCGDTMALDFDPYRKDADPTRQTQSSFDLVAPEDVDWHTEFEDAETGMWWVDMDCVNCLRLANERRQADRRRLLEAWLEWFARHPETIPDDVASALLRVFGPLAQMLSDRT